MTKFSIGDAVPDFTLESTEGVQRLSELVKKADKGVIVYFYPRAMTPGCTTQACDFRDSLSSFMIHGYSVIGISPDSLDKLEKFRDKDAVNFPLASDVSHHVMEAWGAFGEKKNYGKIVQGVIRSSVVVDTDMRVMYAAYNVRAKGHVARLRKELGIDE
ncbi:MAG: peroxiredoxin [Actinomycetaceae bacterium]|nr:peroxiredoxin [Actinomycetaceae bacterium]